jgi:DNA polymerase III epsilon subunit-like protein
MKKSLIIFNLLMLAVTGGFWLIVIIFYVIWKNTEKKRSQNIAAPSATPTFKKFQGPGFAQESARGAVFEYASLKTGNVLDVPFAIIDLETSGLDKGQHRVIEIAVKRITQSGEAIDEISTLINPGNSEVGPTFIHHIKPDDILDAPRFAEFAPELLSRLSNSIVVAHHAAFEDGFLGAEFARIGKGIKSIPCVDTLWLARQVVDLPNYKLATVLDFFGIPEEDSHTALGDVRLLAKLLPILLKKSGSLKFNTQPTEFELPSTGLKIKTRVSNLKKGEIGWLANMMRKLPESGQAISSEVAMRYTELLNQCLSDGKITGEEAKQLSKIAGAGGLGAEQVRQIHKEYLSGIEKLALSDGKITSAEQKNLDIIKVQFGLL